MSSDQEDVQARLQLAAAVIEHTREAVMVADARGRVVSVNPAFCNLTGYAAAQAVGRHVRFLAAGRRGRAVYREMWAAVQRNGHWQGELWHRRRNGEAFPAWQTVSGVRHGRALHYVALFSDIGPLKQAEQRLLHLAHHDALTGLPNRLQFENDLARSLQRAWRQGQQIALLFIDLDCFKLVNDTLGHAAGDELLRVVAARLRAVVRAEDAVARLGGDEFTVVLEEVDGAAGAALAAAKLLEAVAAPTVLQGRAVSVSASIGIALFPAHGADAGALMQAADAAMYRAKRQGRHHCVLAEAGPGGAGRRRGMAAVAGAPVFS
jgi:diguanylate cyclase (GGDEF)-like protein/PAS domain S-box-containing protein